MCCVAVQLLPPSCFETVSAGPLTDFTRTVNDIVLALDEYSHFKYEHEPLPVFVLTMLLVAEYCRNYSTMYIV